MANDRRLVTAAEKARIIEVLKTGSDPIEKEILKKSLPKSCFISGNSSAIAWKQLDKYLQTNEENTFAKKLAKKWKGMLSQTPDKEERGVLLKYLACSQYGCNFSPVVYAAIKRELKKDANLTIQMPKGKKSNRDLIRKISDRFGIPESKIDDALENKASYMADNLISNAVKNLNKAISKSKSKKIAAKNVVLLADPSKSEFDAYKGTLLRPDMVMEYNEGEDRAYLCFEHFGWLGSAHYVDNMTTKLTYCVENGIPFFYAAPKNNDVSIEECDAKTLGSLEASVYNWNKANFFTADNSADAIYLAIDRMLNYIGMQKFNMPIEELFKA